MKQIGSLLMLLFVGCSICFIGCRQPVRTYKFSTGTPDIWASEPQQRVDFSVEWRQ